MTAGFDTGFFIRLLENHPDCVKIWESTVNGDIVARVSCLSIAELRRLALCGVIESRAVDVLVESIQWVCEVIWIDNPKLLEEAARLSHGLSLPMVDSIILASLKDKVKEIWTTDKHFLSYRKKGIKIRLI